MTGGVTYFSRALNDLLERLYDNNKAALAKDSGIDRAVISTLAKPSVSPSSDRLLKLAACLPKEEAAILMVAAAKDLMPSDFHYLVDGSGNSSAALPNDLRSVLAYFAAEAAIDVDVAEFLRTMGKWIGVLQGGAQIAGPVTLHVDPSDEEPDGGWQYGHVRK